MKFVLNIFWWRISSYIYAENFSPLTLLYFLEVIFTVLCGILAVIHQRWVKICWKLEPCKSWRVEVICRPLWFNLPSQRSGQLRSGMPPNNTLQGVTMKSTITTQQWPKEQYHCTEWSVTLDIICSSCHIWWDNVTSWHNVTRLQCYKLAQEVKTRALELSKLLYYTVKALDTCISIVKLLYYTIKPGRDQTLDCLPPTAIYRTAFVCDQNLIPRAAATLYKRFIKSKTFTDHSSAASAWIQEGAERNGLIRKSWGESLPRFPVGKIWYRLLIIRKYFNKN